MSSKKKSKKRNKDIESKKIINSKDINSEDLSDSIPEEVEDNDEFINQVKEFENTHKNSKLINIYNLIGKPAIRQNFADRNLQKEYNKLISLLEKKGILIHFQNEYSVEIKYRFIIEEVFKQDVEAPTGKNNHINIIYEDYHPQLQDEDEEEVF